MQQKFPLSLLLVLIQSLWGTPVCMLSLKKLSEFFPTILTELGQKESYLREISDIELD